MEAKYMTISPAMAKAWLETSRGNPRWTSKAKVVDKTTVKKIADDIKNGLWNPGNGSIAFDESGVLVDGHHRLTAIVAANIPVESLVVFGVKQEGLIHIDENVVRKPHQRLSVDSILVSAASATGDRGAASATGKSSVAVSTGINGMAMGAIGCAICLVERGEWDGETYPIISVKAAIVDGQSIKADTWYTLKNGEFVEVVE